MTLLLEINSDEYKIECPRIKSGYAAHQHSNTELQCCTCHNGEYNTGISTVKLTGIIKNVVVQSVSGSVSGSYVSGLCAWIVLDGEIYCKTDKYFQELFSSKIYETFPIYKTIRDLETRIIQAYRDDTLPDSIRNQLKEIII